MRTGVTHSSILDMHCLCERCTGGLGGLSHGVWGEAGLGDSDTGTLHETEPYPPGCGESLGNEFPCRAKLLFFYMS